MLNVVACSRALPSMTSRPPDFYAEVLGLTVEDGQQPGIIELRGAGHDAVTVYPKPDHRRPRSRS